MTTKNHWCVATWIEWCATWIDWCATWIDWCSYFSTEASFPFARSVKRVIRYLRLTNMIFPRYLLSLMMFCVRHDLIDAARFFNQTEHIPLSKQLAAFLHHLQRLSFSFIPRVEWHEEVFWLKRAERLPVWTLDWCHYRVMIILTVVILPCTFLQKPRCRIDLVARNEERKLKPRRTRRRKVWAWFIFLQPLYIFDSALINLWSTATAKVSCQEGKQKGSNGNRSSQWACA